MRYVPQFDTIRTIAVALVLFYHWLPKNYLINYFNNGLIGVILFFVLSGYLITNILYRSRVNNHDNKPTWKLLTNFYIRRSLRIFPIYYVLIVFLFFISFQEIRSQFIFFATYTQNILFVIESGSFGYLIHFWTLAIEEQFYIFWPFVILFVPIKRIKPFLVFWIIFGLLFRRYIGTFDFIVGPPNYLMPSAIDCFALGSLAAVFNQEKKLYNLIKNKTLLIFISLVSIVFFTTTLIDDIFYISSISLVAIVYVQFGKGKIFNAIFKNKVLMYLGKISYGIYLFHNFCYPLNNWLHLLCVEYNIRFPYFGFILVPEFDNPYLRFIHFFIITIILSSISWFIIEKPFNMLKNRFKL